MVEANLRAFAKIPEAFPGYLDFNFKELQETLRLLPILKYGVKSVTGELEFETGLIRVEGCMVSLESDPVTNACFVRGRVVALSGKINIKVFTNAHAISGTASNINWLAYGN